MSKKIESNVIQYSSATMAIALPVGAILFYPQFKAVIGSKDAYSALQAVIPLFIGVVLLVILSVLVPYIFVRKQKLRAEQVLASREKYVAYMDVIDPSTLDDDSLFESMEPPKKGAQSPIYKPPASSLVDPYAPKPKGFAKQQAELGHPQAPALKPLDEPDIDFEE